MRLPGLALVVAINHAVRESDEWFDEPDDVARVERALEAIAVEEDPVRAAGMIAYRIARAQAFTEGNKRTALLTAKWVLDHNDCNGVKLIPPDDRELGELLVSAASGHDVEREIVALLEARSRP